ncbi:MAG: EAL domain-containing protein [Rhizobiales bacterium]|nr:EAL domain-containing protein [Hyphomicrobiales bacterium]
MVLLVIGALLSLACGLLILSWVVVHNSHVARRDVRRIAAEISSLMRQSREEERVSAELSAQVSILRSEVEQLGTNVNVGVNEMRQGHVAMSNEMRALAERQYHYQAQVQQQFAQQMRRTSPVVVHPSQWTAVETVAPPHEEDIPVPMPPRAGSLDDMSGFGDAVAISLEPVIDLFSGKTAHYRLHHAFDASHNTDADRPERRPALDIYLCREALVLLRRLRKRDNRLNILVPLSSNTLAVPEALSRIAQLHASEPGISDGLVVDIPHAVLASLSQSSLEGLAYMARSGIEMSLSNAAVAGLDLAALDKLNVRYVGIAAGSVGSEPKQSAGIANFVQAARALRVQVIVTGVANAQQATQLMRIARFAAGPAFAEPRRVRRDVSAQPPPPEDVAAAE